MRDKREILFLLVIALAMLGPAVTYNRQLMHLIVLVIGFATLAYYAAKEYGRGHSEAALVMFVVGLLLLAATSLPSWQTATAVLPIN